MPIIGTIASSISGNLYNASYDSIASTTVGAGGVSNVTFSSIPATYTHLQIRANIVAGATFSQILLNSDSGANYTYHQMYADGATINGAGAANQNQIFAAQTLNSTTNPTVMILDVLDYKDTNKFKTVRLWSGIDTNGGGEVYFRSGLWMNTNAISTIQIQAQGGTSTFAQNTIFSLYGIAVA